MRGEGEDVESRIVLCWQYGKTTQCVAAIDSGICISNAICINAGFVVSVFPIFVGYIGAKRFSPYATLMYLVYCVMVAGVRVMYLVQYSLGDVGARVVQSQPAAYAILAVGIFVQCWIGYVVHRFYSCLKTLSPEDILRLKTNQYELG